MVDAPRTEARNLVPTVVATTSQTAYLRLHGRNAATWNVRGRSAAERFDYLYSRDELAEWSEPLRELSSLSEGTYVMFNNNGRSAGPEGPIAQAPTNAHMLRDVLRDGRRGRHGLLTISPSVSRPRTTPNAVRTIVVREDMVANWPCSSARSISRSRWKAMTMQATPSSANPAPTTSYGQAVPCESVGTTRPAARLTASAVRPVRHQAR